MQGGTPYIDFVVNKLLGGGAVILAGLIMLHNIVIESTKKKGNLDNLGRVRTLL